MGWCAVNASYGEALLELDDLLFRPMLKCVERDSERLGHLHHRLQPIIEPAVIVMLEGQSMAARNVS